MEKYNADNDFFASTLLPQSTPAVAWRFVKIDINPFNASETIEFYRNYVTGEWDYRNPQPRGES
jgi:hypothetical protein